MEERELNFSKALIALLRQTVVREENPAVWNTVISQNAAIEEYVEKMGLSLIIDNECGYAFLRQSGEEGLPRLVRRMPLSFHMSLFLALLRSEINEFDGSHGDSELVVTKERMMTQMRLYYPPITDEVKFENKITAMFHKAEEMKFLVPIASGEEAYEVRPVLRSFINAEWLSEFNAALERYTEELAEGKAETEEEDE